MLFFIIFLFFLRNADIHHTLYTDILEVNYAKKTLGLWVYRVKCHFKRKNKNKNIGITS